MFRRLQCAGHKRPGEAGRSRLSVAGQSGERRLVHARRDRLRGKMSSDDGAASRGSSMLTAGPSGPIQPEASLA